MPKRKRRSFTPEQKADAVKLARRLGSVAQAAPAPSANGSIALGFVDLVRIGREFDGTKNSQAELDSFQQTLRKQLDEIDTELDAIRMLLPDTARVVTRFP